MRGVSVRPSKIRLSWLAPCLIGAVVGAAGCGGKVEEGTLNVSGETQELSEANNAMLNYMKDQGKTPKK